ncbi:integrin alpha-9 isoform X2 [Nematostella vectensis]|uniref:integrin alpha-9 isoform X2 n=1 Tax=Nematostella vectensis TaxID=45351 RepID=UPI00207764F5|nr:integrin alpha-9 isoform X2 [Nematostella vectensis]
MGKIASHLTCLFCFLLVLGNSRAFNVDTSQAVIYSHPGGSSSVNPYFGYTVALHSSASSKWILVGSPKSNVRSDANDILEEYGAVFKCSTGGTSCSVMNIDNKQEETEQAPIDNTIKTVKLEEKKGQWLGGSLHSTGIDGKVVTCAPRYTYRGMPPSATKDLQYRWIVGKCYDINSRLDKFSEPPISPCKPKKKGNNYFGYCQSGISAEYSLDKRDIIMGAVGITRWKGGIILDSPLFGDQTFSTQDQIDIGYYMGYAVTSGQFGQANRTDIAGGAPRAENLKGKVLIYQKDSQLTVSAALPQPKNLKMGSYFGSVLCSVDLNNDGYSDMLVGAPLYSNIKDEGRVYVYLNNKRGALNLMSNMELAGDKTPSARFGSAIANAGDLNQDGYLDVAIGAPFEGEHGAVYIYHGSSSGIDTNYKQKILGSSVHSSLRNFGQSISGGLDVDDNGYPDLAIGAYGSNNAVLLKSRRIIDVESTITLSSNRIVLENNNTGICREDDDSEHKCLNVTACFKYEDKKRTNDQDLNITYNVEVDKDKGSDDLRRMYFYKNGDKSFSNTGLYTIPKQRTEYCLPPFTVHFRTAERIFDLLGLLTFDVSFALDSSSCLAGSLCPVLNDYKPKGSREVATFQKECRGSICKPDLAVKGQLSIPQNYKEIRIGTIKEVTLMVDIKNKATDAAYLAQAVITYPSNLDYIGPRASDSIQCTTSASGNGTESATCNVGNPLKAATNKTFGIKFGVQGLNKDFKIDLKAQSANKDTDENDNSQSISVEVRFEADLEVSGSSEPDEVVYEGNALQVKDVKTQEDIGPLITQTFVVQNNGPSGVDGSEITISVPSYYDSNLDNYLLYILSIELGGAAGGVCDKKVINPLDIKVGNNTEQTKESRRKRREVTMLNCRTAQCKSFNCRLGLLGSGDKVEIKIVSRLWKSTLLKINPGPVNMETFAKISIPDKRITQPNEENDSEIVITRANPAKSAAAKQSTPWWVILLAVLGGVALLAIAAFIMYKLGFFKRKRIKDISDPQSEENMVTQ